MLEQHQPRRHEKLKAVATFGGIALATALSLDLLVTSGIQFGRDDPAPDYAPTAYAGGDSVHDLWNPAPDANVQTVAWMTQYPLDEAAGDQAQLAGSAEGARVGEADYFAAPSEDDLYQEIAALYQRQDERAAQRAAERASEEAAYEDAPALEYDDAPIMDDVPEELTPLDEGVELEDFADKAVLSAYGSMSPS